MRKLFHFLLAISYFSAQAQVPPPPSSPPNIVIIFMDDLGYGDLASYGGSPQQTPNLDKLAASGMRFTNFYAAQAVCSASRAALLTGCYPNRLSISGALMPWATTALNPEEETLASLAKKKGYQTGMIGKWHLGSKAPYFPTSYGFDSYFGLPYSNDMWPVGYDGKPITDTADRKFKYPPLYLFEDTTRVMAISSLEDQAQLTQLYTKQAVQFIEQNKESPFFLYLAHSMPHVPIAVSELYKNKSGEGLFADLMMELDDSVGEVMTTLEKNGLTQNTLVLFTSDNGPWLTFGNHAGSSGGLREGKGSAWEGGVRVPCIVTFPGLIPEGTVSNKLATTMDILPTLAALIDAPLPSKKIDGVNILPLLQHVADANPRDHFVYYYDSNSLKAIRQGTWKLVFPHISQTYLNTQRGNDGYPGVYKSMEVPLGLYDLSTDPGESHDLSPLFPEVVSRLTELANQYRRTLGDDLTKHAGTERRAAARIN